MQEKEETKKTWDEEDGKGRGAYKELEEELESGKEAEEKKKCSSTTS